MGWFVDVAPSQPLMQGDVLLECPVFVPHESTDFLQLSDPAEIKVNVEYRNVIIMTQSCDLDQARRLTGQDIQNPELNVMMCPIVDLDSVPSKGQLGNLRTDKNIGQHLLKISDQSYWIVDFSKIYTQPLMVLTNWASKRERDRLRLKSPFLELMAQRFAIKGMRVAVDNADQIDRQQLETTWEKVRESEEAV